MSYDWLLKTFSLKSADYSCLENIPVGMSEKITSEASLVKSGFNGELGVHGAGGGGSVRSFVSQMWVRTRAQDVGFRQMDVMPPVQKMPPAVRKWSRGTHGEEI